MNRGFSLWLDLLRGLAALTVLLGHIAHVRFTRGDYYFLREWNIAADAVVVFFVISGLVIAYAGQRDGRIETFAFNRLTRLLSVVLPAVVLTILLDGLGSRISAQAYQPPYYVATDPATMLLRGLSFTNEWQGLSDRVRLGSNGPLWSLSYEAAYYALFAMAVFLRGALRVVLIVLTLVLVGLPIAVMLPVWALGVWVWRRISDDAGPGLPRARALLLAAGAPMALVTAKLMGMHLWLSEVTARAFAPGSHHAALAYSDEVLWSMVIAAGISAHLIGVASLSRHWRIDETGRTARLIRYVAGGSFSLYAMHYPVLHFLDAVLPETLWAYDLWMLGLTLLACFAFAHVFERPIGAIRRALPDMRWRRARVRG